MVIALSMPADDAAGVLPEPEHRHIFEGRRPCSTVADARKF
jgi:hypothetical protein